MQKTRKIPMRTCVVTNEVKEKKALVRIAVTKDNNVSVDLVGKAPGRGAYLTFTEEVILLARKNKALERKLKVTIPDEIYEKLLKIARL